MTERTTEAPPRPAVRYQLDSGVSGLTPAERVRQGQGRAGRGTAGGEP